MKILVWLSCFSFCCPVFADDLLTSPSSFNHVETVKKLKKGIRRKRLKHFLTLEHHKGARKAKLSLRPTTLILFGNPKVGTPLMKDNQKAGIALPMKILVYDDQDGQTWVSYVDPKYLKTNYGLNKQEKIFKKVQKALKSIVSSVN